MLRSRVMLWLVGLGAAVLLWRWWDARHGHRYDPFILKAARRYGVDPALVKAVVWRESGFDAGALGRAGEYGLMQLQDAAAQEWAVTARVYPLPEPHLLDPQTNTLAGTWYLAKLLRRYQATDHPIVFALADYNAGRGRVLQWAKGPAATNGAAFLRAIAFPGTRQYIETILDRRARYRRDFPAPRRAGGRQPGDAPTPPRPRTGPETAASRRRFVWKRPGRHARLGRRGPSPRL